MFCLPSLAVAQEFGISQKEFLADSQNASQVSSTVHILSMLLRLRQCCCHLSLLKVVITLYFSGVGFFCGHFFKCLCKLTDFVTPLLNLKARGG